MRFTPQTIQMKTVSGFKSEEAIVCGPFAIHRTRYPDWTLARAAWTVTHIPSGYCFFQDATSQRRARQFCKTVFGLFDWSKEDPELPTKKGTPEYTTLQLATMEAKGYTVLNVAEVPA